MVSEVKSVRSIRRHKKESLAAYKIRVSSNIQLKLTERSLSDVADWDRDRRTLTMTGKVTLRCKKHNRCSFVRVRTALDYSGSGYCPGCKECNLETLVVARRCRKPDSKTIRSDSLWRFTHDQSWADKPTQFYFVSINTTVRKIGIAVDINKRSYAAKWQGRGYADVLFLSEKLPRSWVWVAEQVILNETTDFTPKCLPYGITEGNWAGTSELRSNNVTTDWVVNRFNEVIASIKQCGSWLEPLRSSAAGLTLNLDPHLAAA